VNELVDVSRRGATAPRRSASIRLRPYNLLVQSLVMMNSGAPSNS